MLNLSRAIPIVLLVSMFAFFSLGVLGAQPGLLMAGCSVMPVAFFVTGYAIGKGNFSRKGLVHDSAH